MTTDVLVSFSVAVVNTLTNHLRGKGLIYTQLQITGHHSAVEAWQSCPPFCGQEQRAVSSGLHARYFLFIQSGAQT